MKLSFFITNDFYRGKIRSCSRVYEPNKKAKGGTKKLNS